MSKKVLVGDIQIAQAADVMLHRLEGDKANRSGLTDTPIRVANAYAAIFDGYDKDPKECITVFKDPEVGDDIVILKDIEFYSMCEHHMLPFYGKAHIGYVPRNKTIVGISKLARVLDVFAHRLQVQERIGSQTADFLMEELDAEGVAIVIEATHMCIRMRGAMKQSSEMVTSTMKGCFRSKDGVRKEFMSLIGK